MPDEMRPLYLISGTDGAKIEATRSRLRARAEREGGDGALEVFEPGEGRGAPDHEALLAAIPAMSLMGTRRYLLADGVEKWRVLVGDAQRLGFKLEPAAARLLVERMGAEPLRLHNELERLALWAGPGGQVTAADLEEMIADTSEAAVWTLSDAVIEGDARTALQVGEQLIEQGENVTGLIYGLASRLRSACAAAAMLEEGTPPREVEGSLKMHPYAAKLLVGRLQNTDLGNLRMATESLAQLERWCRGDADYGDELALTLALRSMTTA
jgi:DNA polymerase III subunit delta